MGKQVLTSSEKLALEHWKYTEETIKKVLKLLFGITPDDDLLETLELCKYFYVQAMVHGIKHGKEGRY